MMQYNPEPQNTSAQIYRYQGWIWLEAAKLLHQNDLNHGLGPFYYIISHAFELFTKAFLLWKGVTPDELKSKDLGHNIGSLIKRANKLGLNLDAEYTPLIEVFENLNKDHLQRYQKTGFHIMGREDYAEPKNLLMWVEKYHQKYVPL